MVEVEKWRQNKKWLEYVLKYHPGVFRAEVTQDDHPARLSFLKKAQKAFDDRGHQYSRILTFTSIQKPVDGEGYDIGFPHRHYPDGGMTLVHYLDPSDVPTPLHIFDREGGEIVQEIIPEPGLTVFLPHEVWHGVPKHKGSTPRVQFIAMAK